MATTLPTMPGSAKALAWSVVAATVVAGRLRRPSVVSLRGNDLDRGLYRRDEHVLVMHAITRATATRNWSAEVL